MRTVLVAMIVLNASASGCAHGTLFHRAPTQTPAHAAADLLFAKALAHLDPVNEKGSLDSAVKYLDAYMTSPTPAHRSEAVAMRRLVRDAQQLARVQAALNQARTSAADNRARESREPDAKGRDEESLKEIQRLKDELAKANEELERIKKRLASPPKPPG